MSDKVISSPNDLAPPPNSDEGMARRVRRALARLLGEELSSQAALENLGGHASLRIYWRVTLPAAPPAKLAPYPRGERNLMAMVMPLSAEAFKSEEAMGKSSAPSDELPFINVQRFLKKIGQPVPTIDLAAMDLGVLLLEDLGDETFENRLLAATKPLAEGDAAREQITLQLYREAIDLLVDFQRAARGARHSASGRDIDGFIGFGRAFDRDLLRWELDHYLEWGLDAQLDAAGAARLKARREQLGQIFDRVVDQLLNFPQTLALRDYQSRNLMYKGGAWQLIDFQDALIAPAVYDLVALLRDSYIELSTAHVQRLLDYYIARADQAGLPWASDKRALTDIFYLQTVQRKLKDAGRFINIDRVKNNPSFLPYYDSSIRYVAQALDRLPEFEDLARLLSALEPSWPEPDTHRGDS